MKITLSALRESIDLALQRQEGASASFWMHESGVADIDGTIDLNEVAKALEEILNRGREN